MEDYKMQEANRQSRSEGRALCDLTQIKVKDLLDLLELDNQIAWDAANKVLPLMRRATRCKLLRCSSMTT
jgi:hypothetical protein